MRNKLHNNGPELSALSAGMWRLHEWEMSVAERIGYIEYCLQAGVTTFDHADIYGDYGNEALFGEALKEMPGLRSKMEIVTKCGICLPVKNRPENKLQYYNTSAGHIRKSVENSLRNLGTDYLDLVLIHRPDPLMDAGEMADIFMKLYEEGKVNHVGVSNFTTHQFDLFQKKLDLTLVTNQVECSLLHTKPVYDGTFDQAQKMDVSPMIWSPLAGGRLFSDSDEQSRRVRTVCSVLGEKYDASIDQIALAWLLRLPCNPLPVIGTGKTERVKSALKALNINFDRQDWYKLLEASNGQPVP